MLTIKATRDEPVFDLGAFVHQHFSPPGEGPTVHPAAHDERPVSYIARLWEVLKHSSGETPDRSLLLPLPYPYVVPGGRFRELYYWDSDFIMLGLEAAIAAQVSASETTDLRCNEIMKALSANNYAAATAHFDPAMKASFSPERIASIWRHVTEVMEGSSAGGLARDQPPIVARP